MLRGPAESGESQSQDSGGGGSLAIVSYDEKPGIQAIGTTAPDRPPLSGAEEIWRPAGEPYPMPPMKTFRNGQVWLKGFEAAGIRIVPAAVGMNSTEYKGRPACIYDGWCHVGCPIGALANPLVTYLADARKSGAEA